MGIDSPDNYLYLSQSGTYTVDGTNDVEDFKETLKGNIFCLTTNYLYANWLENVAMSVVGLGAEEIRNIIQLVAAIMHLGNITFAEDRSGFADIHDDRCNKTKNNS